ncbi:MAG: hypothetical protein K2I77_06675 [Anaeroplasmataceae bacterium]|nr:hypothetical protein [Anaeroplasmataceae bacterium]
MKRKVKEIENLEEQKPYQVDKLSKVPSGLVILLLKYWAAAAAVFFGVIGSLDIGLDFSSGSSSGAVGEMALSVKLIVLLALFMALLSNYLVRPVVRLMYNRRNNTYLYNMVNIKGILSFILSLLYHIVLSIILFFVTWFLGSHHMVWDPFGTSGGSGIEPFTYGLCYIIIDFIFLFIKDMIVYIYIRCKYKIQSQGELSYV